MYTYPQVPDCEVARCPLPRPPPRLSLVASSQDTTVGSTLSLACQEGFVLIGESVIR